MRKLHLSFVFFLVSSASFTATSQTCSTVSPEKQKSVVEYFRKQYKIPDNTEVTIANEERVGQTCYRLFTLDGKGPVKNWQAKLYLSPDQRFLSGELLDMTLDPIAERQRRDKELMAGLGANSQTNKGPANAPVTIVEFSDFECPYCRKLADIMDQVLPEQSTQVRVVFHHMPLSMHPWARVAAEGAGCAQLQNKEGFWAIHDQVFRHQQEITPTNVKAKLLEYAASAKSLDLNAFKSCLDQEMSLGIVLRDMNLAAANDVNSTPTLFVNGERMGGVKDANDLREIIAKNLKEVASTTSRH